MNAVTVAQLPYEGCVRGIEQGVGCMPTIKREEILWILKDSRVEWERKKHGISEETAIASLDTLGADEKRRIVVSHQAQQFVRREVEAVASLGSVLSSEELTPERMAGKKLLIVVGGDDHFKRISQSVPPGVMIMGLNSDPVRSRGALLSANATDLGVLVQDLERGLYEVEEWGRLALSINGTSIGAATADLILGKADFRLMSRHELTHNGTTVEHRSSGLLVSSGAGSTGWFSSAGMYLGAGSRVFPRTAQYLRWELREPSVDIVDNQPVLPPLCEGTLNLGEVLTVLSRNNSDGIISRDSIDAIPFPRGAVAEIRLHPEPLSVIVPIREVGGGVKARDYQ